MLLRTPRKDCTGEQISICVSIKIFLDTITKQGLSSEVHVWASFELCKWEP